MRLIKLELNNIKSYQQETINFNDGINCIIGLNGSGKSTIIESIGSVLFNYNQRTSGNLLRYNETKGMISLLFEGNDNKLYKIIKTYRSKGSGSIKIIDVDNDYVLHETVSDVYEFVKRVLNIPKEKSLSKMFEEIIAVPQGTFVNAFLETAKYRKENFDKLFELDIYKHLGDEVKVLSDKVQKDYINELEKKVFELNGKLSNYNNVSQEIEETSNKNKQIVIEIKNFEDIYNKKISEKKVLEVKENNLNELYNQKKEQEFKNKLLHQEINLMINNLNKAVEAEKIIKENAFGYNLYIKTNNEIKQNESKYEKYILISNKLNDNISEINKLEEINKYLVQSIHDQTVQLGINRQLIIDKSNEIESKKKIIYENEIKLEETRKQVKELENVVTNIKADYTYRLQRLSSIVDYLLSYDKKNMQENINELLLEIDRKLFSIKENKDNINELEKTKIRIISDIEYLKSNYQYMNDGKCPILKQKCLNINDSSLTDEIIKLLNEKELELNNINSKINVLSQNINNEDELIKERNILGLKNINKENDHEKYLQTLKEIKDLFPNDIDNIDETNDVDVVRHLLKKYQDLFDNYKDEKLLELKKLEIDLYNLIVSDKTQIHINENLMKETNNNISKLINDIEKMKSDLSKNNFYIEKYRNENINNENLIFEYKDIKKIIEEQKDILQKHLSNYELYISNQQEANNQDIYKSSIEKNKEDLELNDKSIRYLSFQIEELEKTYSKKQYEELSEEINKLSNDIVSLKTTLNNNDERLIKLQESINIFNELIKEKEQYEKKVYIYSNLIEKLEIIRKVFLNLPRELSEHIRKYISTYASILYRKISKENVRIDILDDYEVILCDCSDEKKIKSLNQLSGGEQMSVAISIRLAMLKQMSNVDFYFMDEPTINLDTDRRMMVAEVVKDISNELKQLYVISHDDTFETITDNTIKIIKNNNISIIEG